MLAAALAAACLLPAAGCGGGGKQPAPAQAPAPEENAPAPRAARPAPPEDRLCLWLLWMADPELLEQARQELAAGKPFMVVARQISASHPKRARAQADCLPPEGLDPALVEALRGLAPGQVSRPLELAQGQVLVMRTTDVFRVQAQELFQKGRYAEAEEALLSDLELHPASAPAWHLLGLTRSSRQDYEGALAAFRQGLRWDPDNPALLNDRASALASLGRHHEALPLFERALEADPDNAIILENLAWALTLAGGDSRRALSLARRAVELAPTSARAWHTLGRVQAGRGDHAAAVVSLHRAARLDPKLPELSAELAASLRALEPEAVARLAPEAAPPPRPRGRRRAEPAPPPRPRLSLGAAAGAQAPGAEPEPKAKAQPAPEAVPAPKAKAEARPQPSPEPAPEARQAPGAEAKPAPQAKAEPKPQPKPGPAPAPKAQAKPRPEPAPKPAPQAKPKPQPAAQTEPRTAPETEAGAGPEHFVQVASYRQEKLARRELKNWRRLGFRGRLEDWRQSPEAMWHRVLLGPYPSREEALKAAASLKKRNLVQNYHLVSRPGP
jgi:tetratricopeptide (TPR) repeat protein